MRDTKNNPGPKGITPLKGKKMRDAERHELFVNWLTMVLQDDHGRAVVRAMVEEHEIPVIEDTAGRKR